MNKFKLLATDGDARAGVIETPRGLVHTPTVTVNFTPALLRTKLSSSQLRELGVEMLLVNALHAYRAGVEEVHEYLKWDGPVIADSGGFQMVSLSKKLKTFANGVEFILDDKRYFLTPKIILKWQQEMGIDLMMPLDFVVHVLQPRTVDFFKAVLMTAIWFRQVKGRADGQMYYIVQGGLNKIARTISCRDASLQVSRGVSAVAIGGLAWNEPRPIMYELTKFCHDRLPKQVTRHFLGLGEPVDLLECIERGMDTFDCVAATRLARHGRLWVTSGRLRLTRAEYAEDQSVLDEECDCPTCKDGVSRATLRAGLRSLEEDVKRDAQMKLMIHNIRFTMRLMEGARAAIQMGEFQKYKNDFLNKFLQNL